MKLIVLTKGQFAKVDDADFEKFNVMSWQASWNKYTKSFYAAGKDYSLGKPGRSILLHREIMGNPIGSIVDHENHDTLDCQRENLRVCTKAQNTMNRRGPQKNSKSGVRGVSWAKSRGKWVAYIKADGKVRNLGYFLTIADAAAAYASANKEHFGEFGGGL